MPTVEQVVYGAQVGQSRSGRGVLARSPGVSRDCLVEIGRLCEGWGKIPAEGIRRPVLLSFPLQTTLDSLTGRLFAVIRIARGMDPVYHAAIINEGDYARFGRNPFRLTKEGIFVDDWKPGDRVERREVSAESLAPLVSPLPSEADVGLVDESLRQVLLNGRLLLPLAMPDERSDRLLALTVLALPLALKRNLRFASWTTSEVNEYTLASLATRGARLPNWSRFLMTQVCAKLSPLSERYVQQVRAALSSGDLDALEERSLSARIDSAGVGETIKPPRPGVVTATMRPEPRKSQRAVGPVAHVGRSRPEPRIERQVERKRSVRTGYRRGTRGTRGGRGIRWLVLLFAVAIILAFGSYILNPALVSRLARERLRGALGGGDAAALAGVDVGATVAALQDRWSSAGASAGGTVRAGLLEELRVEAAVPLERAAEQYVDEIASCDVGFLAAEDAVDRLRNLSRRGGTVESELLRLELGAYALAHGEDGGEAASLAGSELRSQWDALRRRDSDGLAGLRESLGIGDAVSRVRGARRQSSALADVIDLLRLPRRDTDWARRLESAAQRLPARGPESVRRYREAASTLARLKRAEQAAGFERLAFADDYAGLGWLPGAVRQVIGKDPVAVRDALAAEPQPPLLLATWEFYAALHELAALGRDGTQDEMLGLLARLEANDAVRFDPSLYHNHLERMRLVLAAALIARGAEAAHLPDPFFPGAAREASLDFLARLERDRTPEAWQAWADRLNQPFLAHWAREAGELAAQERGGHLAAFDAAYGEVAELVGQIARNVENGTDWGDLFVALQPAIARAQELRPATGRDRRDSGAALDRLERIMTRPLPVVLTGATVRLMPETLVEPAEVVIELRLASGSASTSAPFTIGPAAPAGSGWVGSAELDWRLLLPPDVGFTVEVRTAETGQPLLEIPYPSLNEGVGAAALPRPRRIDAGSVIFRPVENPGQRLGLATLP
jgi:hypothetical protein